MSDQETGSHESSWIQRNASNVMAIVLFGLLVFVMVIQAAC